MVACKHQPTVFALWTVVDPKESRRNRPWDPGIDVGSHCLKPQHLEDKVFFMGQGKMLGAVNKDNLVFEELVPPEGNKEKRRKGNC